MNPKTGKWEDTFAIITSDPNTKVSAEWLEGNERPPVHLLRILPDEDMTIVEVAPPKKSDEPTPMQSGFLFG